LNDARALLKKVRRRGITSWNYSTQEIGGSGEYRGG